MSEPQKRAIDHILRESAPPWRRGDRLTECGLTADNHPVLTRAEMVARWKELGAQRASLFTCMTCVNTANRHPTWADNPVGALARETERYLWKDQREPILSELRAITALINAHPEEFYGYLDGLASTASLEERRNERQQAKRMR